MPATSSQLHLLYDEHAAGLLGYLTHLVPDRHAAEDLLQEVFLSALKDADPTSKPRAWWFRVARNAALNHLRSRGRRREAPGDATEMPSTWAGHDPVGTAIVGEERSRVLSALERLGQEKREAVVLHHGHGFSVPEVALLVGVPEGTVKSRCHHALASLREELCLPEQEREKRP